MKSNKLFNIFNIGIFLLTLETSHAWMFWNMSSNLKALMYVVIFVIGLLVFQEQRSKRTKNGYYALACVFLFFAYVMKTGSSLLGMAEVFLYMLIIWLVMVMPLDKKNKILIFQTKIWAILLLVSFVAWSVHFIYPLPYSNIQRLGLEHLPPFQNYIFFITTYMGLLDYRFHSIFLEPGHLGCIISFFVMANQYNFKNRYVLIMSIVLLFTLSLAGYVLFYIGFLVYFINKSKDTGKFRRIVAVGVVFIGIWLFGTYYNGGDNYVNVRIVERLQYDEATGDIVGDNRYTEVMDQTFQRTIQSSDVFFGMPVSQYRKFRENAGNGAGIKIWIIQKGIVGALILFWGYFFIARGSKNRRWAMFMLLVYVISSYQRMYFFWASYLIPFICGSALPLFTKQKKNN